MEIGYTREEVSIIYLKLGIYVAHRWPKISEGTQIIRMAPDHLQYRIAEPSFEPGNINVKVVTVEPQKFTEGKDSIRAAYIEEFDTLVIVE